MLCNVHVYREWQLETRPNTIAKLAEEAIGLRLEASTKDLVYMASLLINSTSHPSSLHRSCVDPLVESGVSSTFNCVASSGQLMPLMNY